MQSDEEWESHVAHRKVCGAKTRSGAPCKTLAMPNGRCRMHGGTAGRPIETGKYSRYGIIKSEQARKYRTHFEADPDPTNLLPDVLELRVRIADFCDRYDQYTEALLAWHGSYTIEWAKAAQDWQKEYANWHATYSERLERVRELRKNDHLELDDPPMPPDPGDMLQKPRKVVDILQAGQFLGMVGTLIERIQKREEERGLTLLDVNEIIKRHGVELLAALNESVENDELRAKILTSIADRWDAIPVARTTKPKR